MSIFHILYLIKNYDKNLYFRPKNGYIDDHFEISPTRSTTLSHHPWSTQHVFIAGKCRQMVADGVEVLLLAYYHPISYLCDLTFRVP